MIRIIIDAYNLIFQCGLQPKNLNSPLALHRTRQRLIHELALRIDENQRREVKLVFDAKNPRGPSTPDLDGKGFKIAFSRDYEDADTMVIELLQKHSQPRQLTIVSNDHRIQTAATRRNATAIDADVWFDRLGESTNRPALPRNLEKPNLALSDDETQQLIDEFSDLEDAEQSDDPKTSDAGDNETDSLYNPFPKGYGEDLLDL
ncbi:NYN domain-containing protein [Mariniblastus fucicola]|uniref:YacP-like NYN domain protein n=1 Tax=Mariniblastus fucicola TaxID=980251 RepID=A0A5B9PDI6_9BACT|nr:NYN domain-containing protein [Mariniblastus fucicola]QEG24757.1 YacP-like NYN domain protein [Mariniblastus fucicola]